MDGNLEATFAEHHTQVMALLQKADATAQGMSGRLTAVDQRLARGGGMPAGGGVESIGAQVVRSDEIKAVNSNWKGRIRIDVTKAIITSAVTEAAGSAGAMLTPDRPGVIGMPRRSLRLRVLFPAGRTSSNSVEWVKLTTRTLRAASVAEGQLKPESDLGYSTVSFGVKTLAHWIMASKQILDDVPMLQSLIDQELIYGLADAEDYQLLNGGGTGVDLLGVATNAAPYVEQFDLGVQAQQADVLLSAMAQLAAGHFEADGVVLSPVDWRRLQSLKDDAGRYLGNGPFSTEQVARLWSVPVAVTDAMPAGSFLVGAFATGAQIFDRQTATVELSSEDRDNWIRNLITIRCESRLASVIRFEEVFITGTFAAALA